MKGTWHHRPLCTGIKGVRVAVLGSLWSEYWGSVAVLGSRTLGVLRGRLAVPGVPFTPPRTQGKCTGVPWPRQKTGGTVPAGMHIV